MTDAPRPSPTRARQDAGRRRLVYVSNSAPGEYTGRFRWIEALRTRGYDVTFVLPTGQPWHVEQICRAGVAVRTYPVHPRSINPWQDLRSARQLARILAAETPALVHAFGHKANLHALLARRWFPRAAFVLHVTGLGSPFSTRRASPRRALVRWTLRRAYHKAIRDAAHLLFENHDDPPTLGLRAPARFAVACASGVDAETFHPRRVSAATRAALRNELGLAPDDLVITFVGRLLPEKGLTPLFLAMEIVAASHSRARLLVVGQEERARSRRRPTASRGQDRPFVRWLGRREDVRDILALTHIFVNPSYREGFPRSNLEAAAMGVPVVTTDVPGCRELLREAACGLLVPPGDAHALAQALDRLAADPSLRSRMGCAGRKLVRRRYTTDHVVDRIDTVYRTLLGGRA